MLWPWLRKGQLLMSSLRRERQEDSELEGVVRQSSVLWQAACLLLLYTKELQLAVPCLKQGSLYKLQNGLQIVLLFFH